MGNRPFDKVTATPIKRVVEPESPEADDPTALNVRASTDLMFPDVDDWIICPLLTPGIATPRGGDLNAAYEAECKTLARMLGQIGVPIIEEELLIDPAFGADAPLGTALALLRITVGWTKNDLAAASGVSRRGISDFESGRCIPGLGSIKAILGAEGYPFAALDVARNCIAILTAFRRLRMAEEGRTAEGSQ